MHAYSMRDLVDNFIESLIGNFAVTKIKGKPNSILELTYIKNIETLRNQYTITHFLMTENEIELVAKATCYHLTEDDSVEKYDLDVVVLNIGKTDIIPVNKETITGLLLDTNKVVRYAAEDWYVGKSKRTNNRVKTKSFS